MARNEGPEEIPKKSTVKRKAEEELNIAEKRFIIERKGLIVLFNVFLCSTQPTCFCFHR